MGKFTHAHNGYINMLVQFGAIGFGLFLGFAVLAFRRLLILARRGSPGGSVGLALLCGYAVGAIFDPKLINIGRLRIDYCDHVSAAAGG